MSVGTASKLDTAKFRKVHSLMTGGATPGERSAAKARAEAMATKAGMSLKDAVSSLDAKPAAPKAKSFFEDMDDAMEAAHPCARMSVTSSRHGLQTGRSAKPMARLKFDISTDRPARLDPATKARFRAMTDDEVEALSANEEHASTDDELSAAHASRRLKAIRQAQNLTQDGVSRLLHIPIATIRDWEQGRREPEAAALSLLRILEREPDAVRRAMEG